PRRGGLFLVEHRPVKHRGDQGRRTLILSDPAENLQEEVIVPACLETLGRNAALARRTLEQRHGHPPQHPPVRPALAARPVVVRAEDHVPYPVQALLDSPVPTHQAPPAAWPGPGHCSGTTALPCCPS